MGRSLTQLGLLVGLVAALDQAGKLLVLDEHGYESAAFGVKEVVAGDKTASVSFTAADKAGVFPIKCHLHPAHVVGQFVVLE